MEPLIPLPEPAKARIRTREAQAAAELDNVRRACESDLSNAQSTWGGYFELFRDNLRFVVDQTRQTMQEAERVCAQYVFNVHAVEYRAVVANQTELADVLARLREAVVSQYGEHARAVVKVVEAHELEEAAKGHSALSDPRPVKVTSDQLSWSVLHSEFRQRKVNHPDIFALRRWVYPETVMKAATAASATDGRDPLVHLRQMYLSPDVSDRPAAPVAAWVLEGGSPGARHLFRVLAGRAAVKLAIPSDTEPWQSWLDHLRAESYGSKMPDRPIRQPPGELQRAGLTVPYPPGFEDERIDNVFQASADFCYALSLGENALAEYHADSEAQPSGEESETGVPEKLLYERMSPEDRNYDLLKRLGLKAWIDSHDLVAKGWARNASLQDFVDGCISTFSDGIEMHLGFQGETLASDRCHEIDRMAEAFTSRVTDVLSQEAERLGGDNVQAALGEFSRRIAELSATGKKRILETELAQTETPSHAEGQWASAPAVAVRKTRGRSPKFTPEILQRAREMKQARKGNVEIARVLYNTLTPTPDQRRSVPTILRHHFGSKKEPSGVEE